MSTQAAFLKRIEAYLTEHGMSASAFGKQAVNDRNFVYNVRNGRSPTGTTIDRVLAFMESGNPPKRRKRASRGRQPAQAPAE